MLRLGRHAPERRGELRRGLARAVVGQRQEDAVVVVVVEARSCPMTTITSRPLVALDRGGRRDGEDLGGLHPDGVRDGRRLGLEPRRVVDGRRRLARGGVDGRLHRPAAGADHRRVVGSQAVGARRVGHHHADRAGGDRGRCGGAPRALLAVVGWSSWWWPAPWSSSSSLRRRARWSAWWWAPWSGRCSARRSRWGGSRPQRGWRRRRRRGPGHPPPAPRRANRTCLSAAARRPLGVQPAPPLRSKQAFPLVGPRIEVRGL